MESTEPEQKRGMKMQELKLVRPSLEHKLLYEAMMDEWESFGGENHIILKRRRNINEYFICKTRGN